MIVGAALLIVAIFLALAMSDTSDYEAEMVPLEKRIDSSGS